MVINKPFYIAQYQYHISWCFKHLSWMFSRRYWFIKNIQFYTNIDLQMKCYPWYFVHFDLANTLSHDSYKYFWPFFVQKKINKSMSYNVHRKSETWFNPWNLNPILVYLRGYLALWFFFRDNWFSKTGFVLANSRVLYN